MSTFEIKDYDNLVREYARSYNYLAPAEILKKAMAIAGYVHECVKKESTPDALENLLNIEARLSGILAYAALDLGAGAQAFSHAQSMQKSASKASNADLEAWALGTASLISRFLNRFDQALEYSIQGMKTDCKPQTMARLHGQAALSYAALQKYDEAKNQLDLSKTALSNGSYSHLLTDGIFFYGLAKHHYYSGIAHLSTGDLEASATHSLEAIKKFDEGNVDSRSLSDHFLAHVHLAMAHLRLGKMEELQADLEPVFKLPVEYRTSWHKAKLRSLQHEIKSTSTNVETTNFLEGEIVSFCS